MPRVTSCILLVSMLLAVGCSPAPNETPAAATNAADAPVPAETAKVNDQPAVAPVNVGKLSASAAGVDLIKGLLDIWGTPAPAETPTDTPVEPTQDAASDSAEGAQLDPETADQLVKALEQMGEALESLTKPIEGGQTVIDDAFELSIPPGFNMAQTNEQELNVDGETGSAYSVMASSPEGPCCLFMALTFPVLKYLSSNDTLLLNAGRDTLVSNFKIDDTPFTILEILSSQPLPGNGLTAHEWRLILGGGDQRFYAVFRVYLRAPNVYTVVYISTNESDVYSDEANAYLASIKFK